jgi:hypothetical protein
MRRLLGLTICLALAPGAAAAQSVVSFALGSDSVLTVLTGATRTIELQVNGTGGVSAYNVTLFLDNSQVTVSAFDTVPGGYGLVPQTPVFGTDSVVLSASGTGSTLFTVPIANITFNMLGGATQGSLISLRVNSLTLATTGASGLPGHRTGLLNVCQATSMLGDPSGDRVVNSRDALIALTAAVGLPATGFDLPAADADADGQVTSRDALLILSYGIGISTGLADLGWGIANACAPLTVAPDNLLFFRSSALYQIAKNDSVPKPLPLALAPYAYYPARWSPDSSHILYTAFTGPYYYEIVDADKTGTVVDTLTRNTAYDAGADWSPDGSRIAFVSNRTSPAAVFVMDANGANQTPITANVTVSTSQSVAWSPDGTRIAFAGCQTCSYNGLWVVNVDGTGLTQVVPESAGQNPGQPQWTAGSDSIYYADGNQSYVRVASVLTGDTVASRLDGYAYYSALSQAGNAFQSTLVHPSGPYDFFLRRATDGRYLQLVRGDATNSDAYFAFWRTGGVYVNTVTVTPASPDTVLVSLGTQQFTASVKNNDGSTSSAPVTWSSSNTLRISVNAAGLATLADTTTGTYVKASAGGWRADSVLVVVIP